MHLDGQKHKKRLAQKSSSGSSAANANTRGTLRCELCDVTVVGVHAFNAHIKGVKHNKVCYGVLMEMEVHGQMDGQTDRDTRR